MKIIEKRKSFLHKTGLIATALIILAAITTYGQGAKPKAGLKVTILLYSGRPNPDFVLSDDNSLNKIKGLLKNSKEVKSFDPKTLPKPHLGYNGVTIDNPNNFVLQFPASLHIYKGNVEAHDKGKKTLKKDEGKGMENFLLGKALEKKIIDQKMLNAILKNL